MRERRSCLWLMVLLTHAAITAGCRSETSKEVPVAASEEVCTPEQPGAPRPTHLAYMGPTEAQFGEALGLSAQLTDEAGQPLAGRTLRFVLGSLETTALTGASGLARVTLTPMGPPASSLVMVTYEGDAQTAAASVTATVSITRAHTLTRLLGPTLIPTGAPQLLRASLVRAHDQLPVSGRRLLFKAGNVQAMGTTDASGIATVSLAWNDDTTGAVALQVSFAGDDFYEPSSDESSLLRYLPTAFTIWGGNTPGLKLGQRVNFWGHSWEKQVEGQQQDPFAEFKGFAASLTSFALCQPTARSSGTPRLAAGCWSGRGGQSAPPAQLPEYIGVLVTSSIAKQGEQLYGNVAALVVLKVDPAPAYQPVPGKPGWGTLVAVIEGGPLFPPPPSLAATQRQPPGVRPGQAFEVEVELTNPSQLVAEHVTVSERFEGSLPASAQKAVGSLRPGESRALAFSQTVPVVTARGAQEPEDAYQSRLAAEDGRLVRSVGRVRWEDPQGTFPPAVELFSSSQLQLPRLSLAISAPACAGPCATMTYVVSVANLGLGRASSVNATLHLPDGSQQVLALGALEPSGMTSRTVEWTASDPGPRRPNESVEEYLARLRAWAEQRFTASVDLVWQDEESNTYGPIAQQLTSTPRVAVLTATAAGPSSVLPGQSFPLQFTVTNSGTARANDAHLWLAQGGALSAFSLEVGQSLSASLVATPPLLAPRGEAEPEDGYRMRLEAENGRALGYDYSLDWGTACGSRIGPIPGRVETTQVLPVVTVSLQGPAEAPEGEPVTYTATLRNVGHAEASGLVLSAQLPGGTRRDIPLPSGTLARSGSLEVTFTHQLPASWGSSEPAVAVASVRWKDAVGSAFGPLTASFHTRVNRTPQVQAGPDQTVTLTSMATLVGSITDDGLPQGAALVASWTQVSGPAPVWFSHAAQAQTSVAFSEPGQYVLRLTGSDSQLISSDELSVTVLAPEGIFDRRGTTARVLWQNDGHVMVGADGQTNPYQGDTSTATFLSVLCIKKDGRTAPPGVGSGWTGGEVKATPAIAASVLTSRELANLMCSEEFGDGYRMAELSEAAGGESWWADGVLDTTARFWVAVVSHPANAWDSLGEVPPPPNPPKFYESANPIVGQYLVSLPEETPPENVASLAQALATAYGGSVDQVFTSAFLGFVFLGSEAQARALSNDSRVESVDQDGEFLVEQTVEAAPAPQGIVQPVDDDRWALDRVDQRSPALDQKYIYERDGAGVNVYVLDTGIRFSHQEFGGRAVHGARFSRARGTVDCEGHGTSVASVIGGETTGVAKAVRLISVRIAGCRAIAYNWKISLVHSTIVAGMNWVTANHARPAVANISFGFRKDFVRRWFNWKNPTEKAVLRAIRAGVTVVVAAGNEDNNVERHAPASLGEAITVAAMDRGDVRSSSSNWGGGVDLFAPGGHILAASHQNDFGHIFTGGTSLAAPFVAGVAALFLERNRAASPEEVWSALINNATQGVITDTKGAPNRLLYTVFPENDVGVIPMANTCPGSTETLRIHMDNEDDDEQSRVSGWVGATTVDGNGNTSFVFCRVDGTRFRSLSATNSVSSNYAVLKLGQSCPEGSVEFSRHFDNEDRNNGNHYSGNIFPNLVDNNSTLRFCLFKGDGAITASFPNLGFEYGVFAAPQFTTTSARGFIYTDDEDRRNANSYEADPAWKWAATAIISEGSNTTMNTARALP